MQNNCSFSHSGDSAGASAPASPSRGPGKHPVIFASKWSHHSLKVIWGRLNCSPQRLITSLTEWLMYFPPLFPFCSFMHFFVHVPGLHGNDQNMRWNIWLLITPIHSFLSQSSTKHPPHMLTDPCWLTYFPFQGIISTLTTNTVGPLVMAKHFAPLLQKGGGGFGQQPAEKAKQHSGIIVNITAKVGSIGDNGGCCVAGGFRSAHTSCRLQHSKHMPRWG